MFVLVEYTDTLGRKTRLAVDDDAWVRQEWRRGRWWTSERHPIEDVRSVLGEDVTDGDQLVGEEQAAAPEGA
ncbi:hypothetical protein [Halobacterium rubrum]|uniref:hypothetical protein n=1 Tax=Halobacterium TaxID=2239 RepID=UPI001F27269E|nr:MULTISPECIES: hypothetical protein [Halobacterium]MDH5019012.1 hypothetical protein [Halobacterium rubrum]